MVIYEALYGGRCRSHVGWFEVGETNLIGPTSFHYSIKKVKIIRDRLKIAQSRQKSYTSVSKRELELPVGDWVFIKCHL